MKSIWFAIFTALIWTMLSAIYEVFEVGREIRKAKRIGRFDYDGTLAEEVANSIEWVFLVERTVCIWLVTFWCWWFLR